MTPIKKQAIVLILFGQVLCYLSTGIARAGWSTMWTGGVILTALGMAKFFEDSK